MSSSLLRNPKLERQKRLEELSNNAPIRGLSSDSQKSKVSLTVPNNTFIKCSASNKLPSPLSQQHSHSHLQRNNHSHSHSHSNDTTPRSDRKEVFNWSGVTVSFDAESIKIENEVNSSLSGIKSIGKEVNICTSFQV